MKKLKLPPELLEHFDLFLVDGAARWPVFEKCFTAAFAAAWLRLQDDEKAALLKSWGKWVKAKKPQAWVKFVETLPPDGNGQSTWTAYEPTGGIFTLAVERCLSLPESPAQRQ